MEEVVQFTCNHKRLYGILHFPDTMIKPETIVIMVTGGPQVRTGAHRLYVQLSRFLCANNWPTLRFDYEGMGDSEGNFVGFQNLEPSITAAMTFLQEKFRHPVQFIFWSLCDGATAVALYGARHPQQIRGMILCNPLVITDEGLARSTIRHYYCKRLFEKEFLYKIIRFDLDVKDTIRSLWQSLKNAQFFINDKAACAESTSHQLPAMVMDSLHRFSRPIRIILSTDDIVASNFQDELKKDAQLDLDYQKQKITLRVIEGADHTFVAPWAKKQLFRHTLKALSEIGASGSGAGGEPS